MKAGRGHPAIVIAIVPKGRMMKGKGENSPADRRQDRAGAKKAGMSMKRYEGSPADRKADAKRERGKGKRR